MEKDFMTHENETTSAESLKKAGYKEAEVPESILAESKMPALSLDSLMARKESLASVDEATAGETVQEILPKDNLSEEERVIVEKIKTDIDLTESQTPTLYAGGLQKKLSDFSSDILSNIKNSDIGESGSLLSSLLSTIEGVDVAEMEDGGFFASLFRKGKSKIAALFDRYELVENQVDKIVSQLEIAQNVLLKDIVMYDKLYEENLNTFKELNVYLIAGDEKVRELRSQLPALREEATNNQDPMAIQVVRDFESNIARFEKKLHDLKTSKLIAFQAAPEIKMIQNNNTLLMDKINETISNTIPLWKSQMIIALGLEHQGRIVDMQKAVSETTNKLLRQNADRLKQNTISIAEEAERSIVDIEAVKYANEQLIETIRDSIKVHDDARSQRMKAEEELSQMEEQLKGTLLGVIQAQPQQAQPQSAEFYSE